MVIGNVARPLRTEGNGNICNRFVSESYTVSKPSLSQTSSDLGSLCTSCWGSRPLYPSVNATSIYMFIWMLWKTPRPFQPIKMYCIAQVPMNSYHKRSQILYALGSHNCVLKKCGWSGAKWSQPLWTACDAVRAINSMCRVEFICAFLRVPEITLPNRINTCTWPETSAEINQRSWANFTTEYVLYISVFLSIPGAEKTILRSEQGNDHSPSDFPLAVSERVSLGCKYKESGLQ